MSERKGRAKLVDRRVGNRGEGRSRGLAREAQATINGLRAHDREMDAANNPNHFPYSLEEHNRLVAEVSCNALTEIYDDDDHLAGAMLIAGLNHDWSKVKKKFHIYREKRIFGAEEKKIMSEHPHVSAKKILNDGMTRVREEDRAVFEDASILGNNHHNPKEVERPKLRQACFVLNLGDKLVASMEDREVAGLPTQQDAIAALWIEARDMMSNLENFPYVGEIEIAMEAIENLYGEGPNGEPPRFTIDFKVNKRPN